MKINKLWCLLLLLLSTACSNILDKDLLDTFSNDNFWTSENNVSRYANTFYNRFLGYGNGNTYGHFYFKTLSDDQAGNSFAEWTYKEVPATETNWREGWIEIRRANIMLEQIPTISSMSEEAANHWLGVARLMRAWEYYKLTRMFGDLPWIDKSLNISDEGYIYSARESRDLIMNYVLQDLDFACANIRDNGSKIEFSVDLAYAMKTEVCLYEGTFRKYRKAADGQSLPDEAGAKLFLEEAKKAANALLKKKYTLNSSYRANYNSTDLSKNNEMIFYKAYKISLLTHSTIAYTTSSTQLSGMTKSAFDSYLFLDGKPSALTSENNTDLPVVETLSNGNIVYSISHLLSVRDERLAETIDSVVFHNGRGFKRSSADMEMTSSTGYGIKKYDNPDIPITYRNQTSSNYTHCPLFWMAVIYLQYAEAAAELADLGGEAIRQSDLDDSVNLLKARAGLPPLNLSVGFSDPANNHDVSDLIWEIRRERRCELMFDNWTRYWDLIRWHQLDKLDSTKYPDILLGANVSTDPDNASLTMVGDYMDGSKGLTRTFDKKYYLYPIPSGQITLNQNLSNNYGWN